MNKFIPFVEWLWSKRDIPYTFRVSTLTEPNRREDSTVPVPPLTWLEADNLFQLLARKQMVFFKDGKDPSYLLNKVEPHLWMEFIKELRKPDWQRARWFMGLSQVFRYIICGIIGGYIGGYFSTMGKKAAESPVQKLVGGSAAAPGPNQERKNTVDGEAKQH